MQNPCRRPGWIADGVGRALPAAEVPAHRHLVSGPRPHHTGVIPRGTVAWRPIVERILLCLMGAPAMHCTF